MHPACRHAGRSVAAAPGFGRQDWALYYLWVHTLAPPVPTAGVACATEAVPAPQPVASREAEAVAAAPAVSDTAAVEAGLAGCDAVGEGASSSSVTTISAWIQQHPIAEDPGWDGAVLDPAATKHWHECRLQRKWCVV